MAYYNANEVIKLTRKAIRITQEELCDGVCDVSTLSKIENGHYGVRRDTYRELMKKMGRVTEMRYATYMEQGGRLLEDRLAWERAAKRFDYAAAETYLQRMKAAADDNVLTRQYLVRAEALQDYHQGRICAEEMAERVDRAIRMTSPDYEKYLKQKRVFPFVKEELLALMSLGIAYRKMGEGRRAMLMYETILNCLDADYMGEPDKTEMRITVKYNIAKLYESEGKHREATEEYDACLCLCRDRDYSHLIAPILTSKAYDCVRLVERGEWDRERLDEAKKFLRQAYCLAAARMESESISRIVKYYERYFGKISDS